jgi:hypothetical protein
MKKPIVQASRRFRAAALTEKRQELAIVSVTIGGFDVSRRTAA